MEKKPNELESVYNKVALDINKTKTYKIEELKAGIYVSDAEFEQTFAYKEFVYSSSTSFAIYTLKQNVLESHYGKTFKRRKN